MKLLLLTVAGLAWLAFALGLFIPLYENDGHDCGQGFAYADLAGVGETCILLPAPTPGGM